MTYRGPNTGRIMGQHSAIVSYAGEPCTWREYVSAGAASGSAYYAGGGTTYYYRQQTITALFAAPQMGESRFRETQLAGGQVIAGDMVASTPCALNAQDELIWRGVTYRLEGDWTPIHIGGRVWYRSVLRRGDVTG
jgi:hypothetical protein